MVERDNIDIVKKLRLGYAALIGAPSTAFDTPGFDFYVLENWLQPVWLVALDQTIVCTAASQYETLAKRVFGASVWQSLLSPNLLEEAQNCFGASGWQPLEILYYPHQMIPADEQRHPFTKLAPEHPEFEKFSRAFSGHTYAVLDQNKRILSWAGIKDHGNINEIAVGTEAAYRNKGMGKAVVMSAVADILSHGRVPVYVPDKLTNVSSYALAYSCGFLKGGEMMLWEVEAPID